MEGSLSASKDASIGEPEVKVVTVDAMAEYMRKQEEKKKAQAAGATSSVPKTQTVVKKDPPARPTKDISESSDKYTDEDFDSISKS